jgi:hypothetical protein
MTDTFICPWCEQPATFEPVRFHDDGVEYACTNCGGRHTRKEGDPGCWYPFFPGDIARAFRAGPERPRGRD